MLSKFNMIKNFNCISLISKSILINVTMGEKKSHYSEQWCRLSYIYILTLPSLNWPKLLKVTYHKGTCKEINNLNIKYFSRFYYLHLYVQKK